MGVLGLRVPDPKAHPENRDCQEGFLKGQFPDSVGPKYCEGSDKAPGDLRTGGSSISLFITLKGESGSCKMEQNLEKETV